MKRYGWKGVEKCWGGRRCLGTLGVELGTKGGMDDEIQNRVREGKRVLGGLREVWKRVTCQRRLR